MGGKISVDGMILCVVSSKVIAIRPWVFVYLKFQRIPWVQPGKGDIKRTIACL